MLVEVSGRVSAFVMSCRVFQRRVEFAFLNWLLKLIPQLQFDYAATERNLPFRKFLSELGLDPNAPSIVLTAAHFNSLPDSPTGLIELHEP